MGKKVAWRVKIYAPFCYQKDKNPFLEFLALWSYFFSKLFEVLACAAFFITYKTTRVVKYAAKRVILFRFELFF